MTCVNCPTCGKKVPWSPENENRPFCSARCKDVDLGAWAAERYGIPAQNPPDPMDTPSEQQGSPH